MQFSNLKSDGKWVFTKKNLECGLRINDNLFAQTQFDVVMSPKMMCIDANAQYRVPSGVTIQSMIVMLAT